MRVAAKQLTIGLPVYNGAKYLAGALESVLGQSFEDYELLISDNCSTDATRAICESYARRDRRVRYIRQERNLGAAGNFDFLLRRAETPLFKWAAHDDVLERDYLLRCLEALQDERVVLAHSRTVVIDAEGKPMSCEAHPDLYDPARALSSRHAYVRYAEILLRTRWCFEIFGVFRRELAVASGGQGAYYGADKVLLSAMTLAGPFATVPQGLFLRRNHPASSTSIADGRARALWINPMSRGNGAWDARFKCLGGYLRAMLTARLSRRDRIGCGEAVARYLTRAEKWSGIFRHAEHANGVVGAGSPPVPQAPAKSPAA